MKNFRLFITGLAVKSGDFFRRYTAVCCFIAAFLLEFYIESFAHLSIAETFVFMISNPFVFVMNVLIIAVLLLLCMFVKKSSALFATFFILWFAIGTTNGVVLLNRPFPFTLSDLLILPSAGRQRQPLATMAAINIPHQKGLPSGIEWDLLVGGAGLCPALYHLLRPLKQVNVDDLKLGQYIF